MTRSRASSKPVRIRADNRALTQQDQVYDQKGLSRMNMTMFPAETMDDAAAERTADDLTDDAEGEPRGYGDPFTGTPRGRVITDVLPNLDAFAPSGNPGTGAYENPHGFEAKSAAVEHDLVALHNLTVGNLRYALKDNGLIAPSIAITRTDIPFTNFGVITLVAPMSMVDPQKTPVFDADIYSPRYPTVKHKVDTRKLYKLRDEYGDYIKRTESEWAGENEIADIGGVQKITQSSSYSPALMLAFLERKKGMTFEPIMRDKRVEHEWVKSPIIDEFFRTYGSLDKVRREYAYDAPKVDAYRQALTEACKQAVIEHWTSTLNNETPESLELREILIESGLKFITRRSFDDGRFYLHTADSIFQSYENIGKTELDKSALTDVLMQAVAPYQDEFETWVDGVFNQVRGDRYIPRGQRGLPYTPENVLKMMTKQTRGGENFNFGLGSVRAKGAKRFRTMNSMLSAGDRLVSEAEMEGVKSELNDRFFALVDALRPYHRASDNFSFSDTVTDSIKEGYKPGKSITRALADNYFDVKSIPANVIHDLRTFAHELVQAPTQYFEAKPQRIVRLSEFVGAVVPTNLDAALVDALSRYGLEVEVYADEGDRQAALGRLLAKTRTQRQASTGVGFSLQQQTAGYFSDMIALKSAEFHIEAARTPWLRALDRRVADATEMTLRMFAENYPEHLDAAREVIQSIKEALAKNDLDEATEQASRLALLPEQNPNRPDPRFELSEPFSTLMDHIRKGDFIVSGDEAETTAYEEIVSEIKNDMGGEVIGRSTLDFHGEQYLITAVLDGLPVKCNGCFGTGTLTHDCTECNGEGKRECEVCEGSGTFEDEDGEAPCEECRGSGADGKCFACNYGEVTETCWHCRGRGASPPKDNPIGQIKATDSSQNFVLGIEWHYAGDNLDGMPYVWGGTSAGGRSANNPRLIIALGRAIADLYRSAVNPRLIVAGPFTPAGFSFSRMFADEMVAGPSAVRDVMGQRQAQVESEGVTYDIVTDFVAAGEDYTTLRVTASAGDSPAAEVIYSYLADNQVVLNRIAQSVNIGSTVAASQDDCYPNDYEPGREYDGRALAEIFSCMTDNPELWPVNIVHSMYFPDLPGGKPILMDPKSMRVYGPNPVTMEEFVQRETKKLSGFQTQDVELSWETLAPSTLDFIPKKQSAPGYQKRVDYQKNIVRENNMDPKSIFKGSDLPVFLKKDGLLELQEGWHRILALLEMIQDGELRSLVSIPAAVGHARKPKTANQDSLYPLLWHLSEKGIAFDNLDEALLTKQAQVLLDYADEPWFDNLRSHADTSTGFVVKAYRTQAAKEEADAAAAYRETGFDIEAQMAGVKLYHGTSSNYLPRILAQGFIRGKKGNEDHIFFATDFEKAAGYTSLVTEGRRQGGNPVVLEAYLSKPRRVKQLEYDPHDREDIWYENSSDEDSGVVFARNYLEEGWEKILQAINRYRTKAPVQIDGAYDIEKTHGKNLYKEVLAALEELKPVQDRSALVRLVREAYPPGDYGFLHVREDGSLALTEDWYTSREQLRIQGDQPRQIIKRVWVLQEDYPDAAGEVITSRASELPQESHERSSEGPVRAYNVVSVAHAIQTKLISGSTTDVVYNLLEKLSRLLNEVSETLSTGLGKKIYEEDLKTIESFYNIIENLLRQPEEDLGDYDLTDDVNEIIDFFDGLGEGLQQDYGTTQSTAPMRWVGIPVMEAQRLFSKAAPEENLDKDADSGSSLRELDRGHRDGQPGLTMSKLDMSPEHNEHSNSQLFDMGRSAQAPIHPIRQYSKQEALNEAGEYFENDFTKALAPMLFYTEQEAVNRIRNAETRVLTREEQLDLINSNVGDIINEPNRDTRDALVKEMMLEQVRQADLESLQQAFSEGAPLPPPIVIEDMKGRLSLLGGNSRLAVAAAMDIELPVKVISYKGSFRIPEASEEDEY